MTKEAARELIGEYVKTAEALLKKEFGEDYTPSTIEKLADTLISLDQEAATQTEANMIRQHAFESEVEKLAAVNLSKTIKSIKGAVTGAVSAAKKTGMNIGTGLTGSKLNKMQVSLKGKKGATRSALVGRISDEKARVFKTRLLTGGAVAAVGAPLAARALTKE